MKRPTVIFALALLFFINLFVLAPHTLGRRDSVLGQLGLLASVRHELVSGYVEQPDSDKLIRSAIDGMIASLDDPYTNYLPPDDLRTFDRETSGSFTGIGAEVTFDTDERRIRIFSPLEDAPAWKAGVMAGDVVMEIDGQDTLDMRLRDAIDLLLGEKGTEVTIKVRHETGDLEDITIVRDKISVGSLRGFRRINTGNGDPHWDFMFDHDDRIGYIRIRQFSDSTAEDLRETLRELVKLEVQGLILDLRNNGGGLLDSAVDVSDTFLPAGKTIVSVKGRAVRDEVYESTADQMIEGLPMIVLANEWSASASEIVTGALKDNQRAQIVGMRTFGKGSVQSLKMLGRNTENGALKMTNAYYYIPSGTKIHRVSKAESWGVDPHEGFFVPMPGKKIAAMNEKRREDDILRRENKNTVPEHMTGAWIEEHMADPQLAAAIEAIHGKLRQSEWIAVGVGSEEALGPQRRHASLVRVRERLKEELVRVDEELAKLESGDWKPDDSDEPEHAAAEPSDDEPMDREAAADGEGAGVEPDAALEPEPATP